MESPAGGTLSPNQVIALNLKRARDERGWTQTDAAKELSKNGRAWSKQVLSNAEKGAALDMPPDEVPRVRMKARTFTPEDLLGMALTFEKPVWWFFIPPEGDERNVVLGEEPKKKPRVSLHPWDYLNALFPTPALMDRIRGALPTVADQYLQEELQKVLHYAMLDRQREIAGHQTLDMATSLAAVIRHMESLIATAKAVYESIPPDPVGDHEAFKARLVEDAIQEADRRRNEERANED